MTCRMLAETVRRRSRHSKFETRAFVRSRSSFSRSLSVSSSGLALGDFLGFMELNKWLGIGKEVLTPQPPEVQCRKRCTCQSHWPRATALHTIARRPRLLSTKYS